MKNIFAARCGSLLFASVSTFALAPSAWAQDRVEASPAATPPAEAGGLEEIVVTARKRVETLQNIPVAVQAFTPAQIQRNNISSIERIAAATPNLTVGKATSGSGAQISLRGIGTPASALGIESSTAIIVDGAYYGNGRILNEGFFDLARIQVLKGPQALFFGKNATAGVIAIDSANPTTSFEGSARAGYEFRAQQVYGELMLSGPLTDTLGVRVALRGAKMFGGYSRNRATPVTYTINDILNRQPLQTVTAPPTTRKTPREREFVGRVTVQWEPIDGLTNVLKLSGALNHVEDPGWNNIVFSCANGTSTLQPGVPCERKWHFYHNDMPAEIAADFPYAKDGKLYADYRSFAITNNLEYALEGVTLTANTNYQFQRSQWLSDSDYQQRVTQLWAGSYERWRAFSEEVRATTNYDSPVNFMAGLLYQRTWLFANQPVYFGNSRVSTAPARDQYIAYEKYSTTDGETISPFTQVVWKVVPQIEVSAGIRYTHETKDSYYIHPVVRPGQIYRLNQPIFTKQTFNNYSPEIVVSYRPTSSLNIYGGFKTGYKSGGFSNESAYTNASDPADLDFEPEKAKGFEGGVKVTTLDNQLRLGLATYSYKYTNLQVDFFEAQSFRFLTTNAGSARTKGVELNADFAPRAVPGMSLRGSVNYNKAYYIRFIAPCVTGQTPAQGCQTTTASPFGGLFVQDLSGAPTANAPHWTGSLGGTYEAEAGGGLKIAVSTDARYSGSYNASPFHNPLATQGRYVNLDASLSLRADRWDVTLIGKNLTNRFVISGALDTPSTGSGTGTAAGILGDQRGYANNPRTVQLQFTYRY
ncbi:TonB-dependent receptor [Sphingomonas naphthae]|uniref:TonB-dependent receptor n=1 Tax=Sphingomonas naphthae TaxID=1813468 RepID=A0ABY7TQ93_9SPHN|nr:TonB-dependent receptor [Sphingomonas naphthae]WCT74530.1 TonB-dependent receptor [Sphingomonas naphthae]